MIKKQIKESKKQPRPPQSGSLTLKMLTLIGMLVMVVYAMYESGKPENWQWMNFPKDTPAGSQPADSQPATGSASVDNAFAEDSIVPQPSTSQPATGDSATQPIRLVESFPAPTTSQRKSEIPIESAKFWRQIFNKLDSKQHFELFSIIDRLQATERIDNPAEAIESQKKLIEKIKRQRLAFDDQLLDNMTSLPSSSQEKSRASEDYFEADKFWNKNVSVALTAFVENSDITLTQLSQISRLQHFLEGEAFNFVQDNTAIGWTGDSVAWNRSWKRIHAGKNTPAKPNTQPDAAPNAVSRIQLIAQPNEYRGQYISIQGFVRALESRTANANSSITPDSQPGDYSILWIKPQESQAGPYCVYTNELPDNLPSNNEQLKTFDSLATIDGIFFKNRSYPAASGEVLSCPLIIASKIKLTPAQTAKDASLFWQPGRTAIYTLAWLVPLVAIGGTWLIFRAAGTRKRLPGAAAEKKLGIFLGDLKDDPNVQTDLQKVQAISQQETQQETQPETERENESE